jgi:hypothetical protein
VIVKFYLKNISTYTPKLLNKCAQLFVVQVKGAARGFSLNFLVLQREYGNMFYKLVQNLYGIDTGGFILFYVILQGDEGGGQLLLPALPLPLLQLSPLLHLYSPIPRNWQIFSSSPSNPWRRYIYSRSTNFFRHQKLLC